MLIETTHACAHLRLAPQGPWGFTGLMASPHSTIENRRGSGASTAAAIPDPTQIHQAVMNRFAGVIHAMIVKERGHGTGMGIAVAHGTAGDPREAARVNGRGGQGWTFQVLPPVSRPDVSPEAARAVSPVPVEPAEVVYRILSRGLREGAPAGQWAAGGFFYEVSARPFPGMKRSGWA